MADYIPKQEVTKASQWRHHGDENFDLGIEIEGIEGTSGYSSKLGYIAIPDGNRVTVRPNEYVLISPAGKISTMPPDLFEAAYEPKAVKKVAQKPKANNNASTKANDSKDNAEVI